MIIVNTTAPNLAIVKKMKSWPTAELIERMTQSAKNFGYSDANWMPSVKPPCTNNDEAVNSELKRFTPNIIWILVMPYDLKISLCQFDVKESNTIYIDNKNSPVMVVIGVCLL